MDNNNLDNISRLVIVCEPGPIQQQIVTALSSQQEFMVVEILITIDKLARDVRNAAPDIILVGSQIGEQPEMDIINELALQFPDVAIIAVLPNEDPSLAQQVMLAGARAFIVQPFTQLNLLSTLRRVRELEARRIQLRSVASHEEKVHPIRLITVYGPRGGTGTSTVAVNLALSLYENTGKRVLLFDGKLFFGHIGVMLNIRAHNSVADFIPHISHIDETLIRDVIVSHATGLQVLLSPSNVQVAQGIRPDDLYNILMGLERIYDYIVIDAGSSLNENSVTLMDAADRVILVTMPDLVSLHDASAFIQISKSLGFSNDKLLIVLNRSTIVGGIKNRDIETVLHYRIYSQIPDDESNAIRCLNRGIPMVMQYPRSPVSRSLKQLATTVIETKGTDLLKVRPVSAPDKSKREALLTSSRLG